MKKNISRRDFFKLAGAGTVAATAVSCAGKKAAETMNISSTETTGEMEYREGPSGDKVSLLGYGCMRWPMIEDEAGNKVIDQEMVNTLVDYAIAHGINYFDTAPVYLMGQSEAASALALSRYPRESYYLATKLSNYKFTPTFEASVAMYKDSLEKMKVDYIDYYLLHNIYSYDQYLERFINNHVIDYLLKEREAGRIRHLGFSVHCDRDSFAAILNDHEKYHWDFVQIQLNYVDWVQDAEWMYNELVKRNIPAIIMEPLLGGQLASLSDAVSDRLRERRPNDTIASWAFRFCGSLPGVLTVLSGMTYMEHLQDNLKTFSPLVAVDAEEMNLLNTIAREYIEFPTVGCTDCKYCLPCPYGVDIPGVFRHYNKCLNEGMIKSDQGSPEYRKARRAFLVSLDRNVEKFRQADHCIGCGECGKKCPQRIPIPHIMHRMSRFVEDLKKFDTKL